MTKDGSNRSGDADSVGRVASSGWLQTVLLAVYVLAAFTAVTAIFFFHWTLHLGSLLIGPAGDNLQDYWNTWYGATKASKDFFFTTLIRYPTGTPLYYNSFDYPQIAVVAFLSRVLPGHVPLIVLHNITLLAAFPLAGTGAFFLTRHFTKDILGASVGGFLFAFSPWHVEQAMHHAHVSSIEFLPMFVLAYLLALERKSVAWLCVAVGLYALNALSCWYYLIYVGFFLVFHFAYTAIRRKGDLRWSIGAPLACVSGVLLILSPLVIPMVTEALHGAPVYANPQDPKIFVADLAAYFVFPQTHLLAGLTSAVNGQMTGNPWEATVYLGLANLAVLGWGFLRSEPNERSIFIYLFAGMAVFAVLASGDELHFLSSRLAPMPGALLSSLPFFANARTPSRAIVFVYLFLGVGVGLAGRMALDRYRGAIGRIGCCFALVLMVADFLPTHLDAAPASCEPGWAWIRGDKSGRYGILMLPRGLMGRRGAKEEVSGYFAQISYMYEQAACHEHPIVQGTPSRDVVTGLLEALDTRDLKAQRTQLQKASVKYIVIDRSFPWDRRDGAITQYSLAYPIAYDGDDMTILRVY